MQRAAYIELILRQIYGEQPSDDASITTGLVNTWLEPAIGAAAKQNYRDNIALDGIGYVNGAFYTTFRGLVPSAYENFVWKVSLPQLPLGIGQSEGISTLQVKESNGDLSHPCIPLSQTQRCYHRRMRPIPNKLLFYSEGSDLFILTHLSLIGMTASVSMVSGGVSTDLNSQINVPPDYFDFIVQYVQKQLIMEKQMPKDSTNDGAENTNP